MLFPRSRERKDRHGNVQAQRANPVRNRGSLIGKYPVHVPDGNVQRRHNFRGTESGFGEIRSDEIADAGGEFEGAAGARAKIFSEG